jgi:alkylation response protein AidB-like acyl-CoA dehydrogenase
MAAHEDLRDSAVFHHALGGADAAYRAAQAILNVEAERLWAQANTGSLPYACGAAGAHTLAWVAKTCAEVVDTCYTLAGGDAVYETSRLQRRLRDVHAVTQHKTMSLASFTEAGAALVGQKVFNPLVP